MSKRDDGGPAFPRPVSDDRTQGDQPDGNRTVGPQDGMSLRDYFAGQALAGWFAGAAGEVLGGPDPINTAATCYTYADAMLAQRAKP